ncbi:RnfABCDGE type electron transport complex subunit D [Flammeovirgaceae bacterium SG7u.111]|nr:RnfABCDGE type electron transport complex subunit D [Flammeovirgaceae bacterium SG7u.132]WPO34764.1 RnfABCDGE type electron transport complex subunit D [Flammeovirgaceae bacterium SG7u.111]
MSTKLLTVSSSPHIHQNQGVSSIMWGVVIAMIPAFAVSVYNFGVGAVYVTALSVAFCIMFEYLIVKYLLKKTPTIMDGSAAITGVLLAFNVPSNLPWWIILIGALVAIGIGKLSFGGLGNNPFNPALVGRVFLLISFPVQMTSWPKAGESLLAIDGETGATPLGLLKDGLKNGDSVSQLMGEIPSHLDFFFGLQGGSTGEISALALLLGLGYMLYKKIITWHIPFTIFGTVLAISTVFWMVNPEQFADPIFHLLTGGLMLGAIFMATDYVTSPMTAKGMIIYAIGIGFITMMIRFFGSYPEGISFAILIMNAFVPLLNKYVKPARFGKEVKNG